MRACGVMSRSYKWVNNTRQIVYTDVCDLTHIFTCGIMCAHVNHTTTRARFHVTSNAGGIMAMAEPTVKPIQLTMDADVAKTLRERGVWLMDNVVLDKRTYTLTAISRICDINPQWLRVMFKKSRLSVHKNARGHWVMNHTDVAELWATELTKHTRRARAAVDGKTYTYRRPTQWAYHLVIKYIDDPANGVPKRNADIVRAVMGDARDVWQNAYNEKIAKRAAVAE